MHAVGPHLRRKPFIGADQQDEPPGVGDVAEGSGDDRGLVGAEGAIDKACAPWQARRDRRGIGRSRRIGDKEERRQRRSRLPLVGPPA
jgi:hypothetical protein